MRKNSKGRSNGGLFPNSLRIISSCIRTVSTNATTVASSVRSAGESVAASIAAAATSPHDLKDQVTWAGFDKLELDSSSSKNVLLLGYLNGFQVLDVDDAANVNELVSKRDCAVTFLQMLPLPDMSSGEKGFRESHPLLLVVASDDANSSSVGSNQAMEPLSGTVNNSPTSVRLYSLRSHSYVHTLRFRSPVCMVRCSSRIVAVGLPSQIYCFDALTLVSKFSVLTYPVPQLGGPSTAGVNIGYGPMAVGPRWLAYASSSPLSSNSGRLSPQYLCSSAGPTLPTSPSNSTLVARYAVESSKQLAAGILNLGDKSYKTISKYYQDFHPDGSTSPISSQSGWKTGWQSNSDTDNAGVVLVKDFITREIIAQFKAHSSPISAICFDPSGTLLVTASVYGNNINIFRIMPHITDGGSSSTHNYDWRTSHVHLYKLHRGIRSAVIQDICFSQYSQWVAIVSSKGTCHVFFLSPFGGDAKFQTVYSESEEPTLSPAMPLPWWAVSSCSTNQPSYPAPSPISLAVVTRLRNSDSGWLGTVGNAAAFSTGKGSVPSGAMAAVFHNSCPSSPQHVSSKHKILEHLLVYTPSGHVVQHKLVPSIGPETSDESSIIQPDFVENKYDDVRVKVESVQWWDVCRRTDWVEREEYILPLNLSKQDAPAVDRNTNELKPEIQVVEEKKPGCIGSAKAQDRSHIYLAKAEVQRNFGSFSWHDSKMSFHMMFLPKADDLIEGEIEIEKLHSNEVEISHKDPLPVFEHYQGAKFNWNDRGASGDHYTSFSDSSQGKARVTEEIVISHSNPGSLSSTESSDGGSSRRVENLLDLDRLHNENMYAQNPHILGDFSYEQRGGSVTEPLLLSDKFDEPEGVVKNLHAASTNSASTGEHFSADSFTSHSDVDEKVLETSKTPIDLSHCFQEEYCKASDAGGSSHKIDVANDDANSGNSNMESQNSQGRDIDDNQDMFGGMLAFFEEDA